MSTGIAEQRIEPLETGKIIAPELGSVARQQQRQLIRFSQERRLADICFGNMDEQYVARMRQRLENMRKVASMAHDPRIIELVTLTADQLEQDILKLEAGQSEIVTIHLEPPTQD